MNRSLQGDLENFLKSDRGLYVSFTRDIILGVDGKGEVFSPEGLEHALLKLESNLRRKQSYFKVGPTVVNHLRNKVLNEAKEYLKRSWILETQSARLREAILRIEMYQASFDK